MSVILNRSLNCFNHFFKTSPWNPAQILDGNTGLMNLGRVTKRNLNLLEHVSYELLQKYGIKTPKFGVAKSKEEAKKIYEELKVTDCVLKAQVLTGGRQKGHFKKGLRKGVHSVSSANEVEALTGEMIGDYLITKQTGAAGIICNKVMITERKFPRKEYYFAIMMDRTFNGPAIICSAQGGTSIEEVAADSPSAIITEPIDIIEGLSLKKAVQTCEKVGLTGKPAEETADALLKLYKMFIENDALLLELNPYVEGIDGEYFCLDAKFRFDDSAKFRQEALFSLRDLTQEKLVEVEAAKRDLNYIQLDGQIACLVNGAGLAMATMDIIKLHHGDPANFLDVGGAATLETIQFALQTILHDPKVKSILVNIFGGIMRCDLIAEGLISAVTAMKLSVPIVCRLLGTKNQEAKAMIAKAHLKMVAVDDLDEAAQLATKIAMIITLADQAHVHVTID